MQINKLKQTGDVILMGDFNAKLEINKANCKQKESRNGKLMNKMMEETNTKAVTLESDKGIWTRVKRKDETERSVIDYVIMSKEIVENNNFVLVDEEGVLRLEGKEETDHNTILIQTNLKTKRNISKQKILNLKDKEGWDRFNNLLKREYEHKMPESYDRYEKKLKELMHKSFKTITITKGKYKYKKTEKAKELKRNKKTSQERI